MTFVFLFSIAIAPFCTNAQEPGEHVNSDSEMVARLAAIWAGKSEEIATAQITCRYIFRAVPRMKVSREAATKTLQGVDLVSRPGDARIISESFGLGIPAASPLWGTLSLLYDPDGFRQATTFDGKRHNDLIRDKSGDVVRAEFANNQVDIFAPGKSRTREIRLDELRPTLKGISLEGAVVISRARGEVTLKVGSLTVVADERTGFVTHLTKTKRSNKSLESSFRYPTEYPGGILFPTEIVAQEYHQDHLASLEIMIVEQAQFNVSPPENALALGVGEGARVFDRREGGTTFFQPRQPVSNVKEEIDRLQGPPVASTWSIYRQVFFGITLLVFVVVLAKLLLRNSPRAPGAAM
jgi:hypothetical protein